MQGYVRTVSCGGLQDDFNARGHTATWSPEEVEEAFRRFQVANPEPKGELEHVNPYTLLVAVVLSAQATDAGVNKATRSLFASVDTPEKMVSLGERDLREAIKTIGLYRNKAKNVIALSQKLLAEHGGQVPNTREALEALAAAVQRCPVTIVLHVPVPELDQLHSSLGARGVERFGVVDARIGEVARRGDQRDRQPLLLERLSSLR